MVMPDLILHPYGLWIEDGGPGRASLKSKHLFHGAGPRMTEKRKIRCPVETASKNVLALTDGRTRGSAPTAKMNESLPYIEAITG